MSDADVHRLAPFLRVRNILRSQQFYALFGFKVVFEAKGEDGQLYWAHLKAGSGSLMIGLADKPAPSAEQGVMLYFYCEDLISLRARLVDAGSMGSEITHPPYMQEGEMRIEDPDGYTILIGQAA